MPAFIDILKKIAPYIKYILFVITTIILIFLLLSKTTSLTKSQKELDLYKRQISGQLTTAEQNLESANTNLNISQSKLLSEADLLKAAQSDGITSAKALDDFKSQYQLQLQSYQKTIAQLKESNHGGTTSVSVVARNLIDPRPASTPTLIDSSKDIVPYIWKSLDGRFELDDPDIFIANNEIFKSNQNFRVVGQVFKQKSGFLETQHLTLEEVIVDGKNYDGTTKYTTIGTATIVDSTFKYSEDSPDTFWPHKGYFGVWPVISANFALNNNILNPRFMLGTGLDFLSIKGFGIGIQAYLDTSIWQESGFGVSADYRPSIGSHQLNIAVNIGIATQFKAPFQSIIPMAGISFLLW